MTPRTCLVIVGAVAISLAAATPTTAQRSGFIIGFGMGPSALSTTRTVAQFGLSEKESRLGLATNFHVGGVVGNSLELYWTLNVVWHATTAFNASYAGTGMTGLGVTYPLSSSGLFVKGAVGLGRSVAYFSDGPSLGDWDGLGVLAGGRYLLSDTWALDLDIIRDSWNSGGSPAETGTAWLVELTMNVLSH